MKLLLTHDDGIATKNLLKACIATVSVASMYATPTIATQSVQTHAIPSLTWHLDQQIFAP